MHASRQDKHRRVPHHLGDRRRSLVDLIDERLMLARGDEHAWEHGFKASPPPARREARLEVMTQQLVVRRDDARTDGVREQPVRAHGDDVTRGVASVRRCVRAVFRPGRDEQRAAKAEEGPRGFGAVGVWWETQCRQRWVRVEELRSKLQDEVAACRVACDDDVGRGQAFVQQVLDGCNRLAQLSRERVLGCESLGGWSDQSTKIR